MSLLQICGNHCHWFDISLLREEQRNHFVFGWFHEQDLFVSSLGRSSGGSHPILCRRSSGGYHHFDGTLGSPYHIPSHPCTSNRGGHARLVIRGCQQSAAIQNITTGHHRCPHGNHYQCSGCSLGRNVARGTRLHGPPTIPGDTRNINHRPEHRETNRITTRATNVDAVE